jgi:hypothetical protein
MRRWLAAGVAGIPGVIAFVSCVVPGFDLVAGAQGGAGPGPNGSGGAGPSTGSCQGVRPPAANGDDGNMSELDFTVAVRTIDLGEDDVEEGPRVGYDLDNTCTCLEDAGPSCVVPDFATEDHCDGPGGIDNAVAQLFNYASVFNEQAFDSQFQSENAEQGDWSLIVRVQQYNGQANDEQVVVSLYASPGMQEDPCLGPDPMPAWDGSDRWPVDSVSLETAGAGGFGGSGSGGEGGECVGGYGGHQGYDVDQPRFFDAAGYVAGGVVVANVPEAGLSFVNDDGVVQIKLVAGFLTARIEALADGYGLRDGVLTGRWRLSDFFATLNRFTSGGEPLCTDSAIYALVKNAVCKFPDIAAEIDPNTPCDALSFGMSFSADPAQIGAVNVNPASNQGLCPPETDPTFDSCENP